MLGFMILVAAMVLLAGITSKDSSATIPSPMKVDALSLVTPSHHRRHLPSSRAAKIGLSMAMSPRLEPNTNRRPRESRSASPLVAFYDRVWGRFGHHTESEKDEQTPGGETDGNAVPEESVGEKFDDEDLLSKDMIQRQQELQQRYENFRGRGRWGGYSMVPIHKESDPKPAPLSVVSTEAAAPTAIATAISKKSTSTSVAPTVTKSTRQRQQQQQLRRTSPITKITEIQQYKDEVVDDVEASLVVVRFYATWCKACKAVESSYYRLPKEFPSSSVKFVEVPLTKENAYMHKGLGIPSLPFAHVYHNYDHIDNNGTGEMSSSSSCRLVEELKINKSKFSEFKRVIGSYVDNECEVYYSSETAGVDTITIASASPIRQTNINSTENEPEAIPTH